MAARSMARGVGVYTSLVAKSEACIAPLVQFCQSTRRMSSPEGAAPKRSTAVAVGSRVVLVEEWESRQAYDKSSPLTFPSNLVSSYKTEFFPETLHVSNRIDASTETVGILVRQKTSSTMNGEKLRDAQREAYERQMNHEPGCTCCIILAGSQEDDTQVRIIELWKTMQDFYFHEKSDWHAKGEEKVVPLVIDMDCDFVQGWQLLQCERTIFG